jgi:hypothetical protein
VSGLCKNDKKEKEMGIKNRKEKHPQNQLYK